MDNTDVAALSGNRLIDALPATERASLNAVCERVRHARGTEIYGTNDRVSHVYFPVSGVYSILVVMEDGKLAEGATIGNEGLVGLWSYLGIDFSIALVEAQIAGEALRVSVSDLMRTLAASARLEAMLRRYVVFALRSSYQSIGCNALHTLEQRCARWILASQDQAGGDILRLTHEYLSDMLGVRRQSVSVVAGALQKQGLISNRRGVLTVLDRAGLEAMACECYEANAALYRSIVG